MQADKSNRRFQRNTLRFPALAGLAGVMIIQPNAAAVIHDAANDFSIASNPNGVWSYGNQTALGGGFNLSNSSGLTSGLEYVTDTALIAPSAFRNPTNATIIFGGTVEVHPGQLALHPGSMGEYSIVRFTAPISGSYTFSATFIGEDFIYQTSTDVHLLVNNFPVFSGLVNGHHATASSGVITMPLLAGDTIDAAVGWGVNGDYYGDTTALEFTVDYVPSPGSAAMIGLGGLLMIGGRRRTVG